MLGFSTVKVSGSSMSPTFMPGDWLIVKSVHKNSAQLKIGSVYLVSDPVRPGVKLLKRLKEQRVNNGVIEYWVEGDSLISEDSRKWGWLGRDQFLAKVVIKYRG
jgi:nickel-type superoxide dismutase maturation protease